MSSKGKILLVEDDRNFGDVLSSFLEMNDYDVTLAPDGEAGLKAFGADTYDLCIFDVMMPKKDGFTLAEDVRAKDSQIPIIFLTARHTKEDVLKGFRVGADDYMVKPFSPQELVSRVRAVLRRAQGTPAQSTERTLEFDSIRIDPVTRLVTMTGVEISLTAKEFDLLWFMANHPRQVFNRDQLLDRVWGETDYIDPSTVTVHVRRVREKIEPDAANPRHIHTVWGVGYKFEP